MCPVYYLCLMTTPELCGAPRPPAVAVAYLFNCLRPPVTAGTLRRRQRRGVENEKLLPRRELHLSFFSHSGRLLADPSLPPSLSAPWPLTRTAWG